MFHPHMVKVHMNNVSPVDHKNKKVTSHYQSVHVGKSGKFSASFFAEVNSL